MISVCIATFNGEKFIREQLISILDQLEPTDEVIVSDDGSSDRTVQIVADLNDVRIKIRKNSEKGIVRNFETALLNASGDVIFLADQDDIWLKGRVKKMLHALHEFDLVISNAIIYDESNQEKRSDLFSVLRPKTGFFNNLARNRYPGCCIAFRAEILNLCMPFPKNIPMHDWWITLISKIAGRKFKLIDQPLMLYRRHGENASYTTRKSVNKFSRQIYMRILMMTYVVVRLASRLR
jgi:glycosyltransferase involved in cell wall biosynthesis